MTLSTPETAAPPATFTEIRLILGRLPPPDLEAATKALERQCILTKPLGALGRLEELAEWLARWQGRALPQCERPHIAVFVGAHGVADRGVSAYSSEVNRQMLQNFIDGGAAVNQIASCIDATLRVFELDLDRPTADFTQGPAMDEARCARAIAYGMMAAEPGTDVLCLGEMGIGNTTSASALCLALYGGAPEDWVGPGTGIRGEAMQRKLETVRLGTELHAATEDPLAVLAALGGEEFAAIAGAIIAARMGRIPVLLDGFACTAAAAVLHAIEPHSLDHCQVAHRSTEPGHARLLQIIGKTPLLDLDLRLGEASGAALAVSLLKAACACLSGMATFEQAGVKGAVR